MRRLVAVGVLACVAEVTAPPAEAYTAKPEPWVACALESGANQTVLERSISPVNGATVTAGVPVTFAGPSEAPLTFAVASSPAALSAPDVDQGLGSAQANLEAGAQPRYTYAFTSTKASAVGGTVYWQASFLDATLTPCAGLTPHTYRTAVRALAVTPARTPPVPTGPVPTPPLHEPAPKGTVVGMWKGDGKVVAFRGKTVIFRTKPGRQGRFVLPLLPGGYEVAVRRPSGRYCPAKRVLVHAFQATRVALTCPK